MNGSTSNRNRKCNSSNSCRWWEDKGRMIPIEMQSLRAWLEFRTEAPADASAHMQAILAALHSKRKIYKEREVIKALEEPLNRLKSAPDQERVAFVFEALAHMASPKDIAL